MQFQQNQNREPLTLSTSRYYRPAAEYVAVLPTCLALARWTRGGDIPHVYSSPRHAPLRAAWYAQVQRHFQAWLEDGGFHRPDAEDAK